MTAVEFAMVALPFLLMLMMVFQIALYQIAQNSLTDATRSVSRLVMTGQIGAGNQSADAFRNNLLCPALVFYLECDALTVRAAKVNLTSDASSGTGVYQFVDAGSKTLRSPSGGFCLGAANDYIFLDISYKLSGSMTAVLQILADNGLTSMRSTSLFRNEPFSTGGSSC